VASVCKALLQIEGTLSRNPPHTHRATECNAKSALCLQSLCVAAGFSGHGRCYQARDVRRQSARLPGFQFQTAEALIGPDTVNTALLETIDEYRDYGEPKARLEQNVEEAHRVLERLPELGISINNVTRQLEDEGVEKFNKPFDKLMATLEQRSQRHLTREP
jgi:hypothetical protein